MKSLLELWCSNRLNKNDPRIDQSVGLGLDTNLEDTVQQIQVLCDGCSKLRARRVLAKIELSPK